MSIIEEVIVGLIVGLIKEAGIVGTIATVVLLYFFCATIVDLIPKRKGK